jgi:hypothetical protein
MWVVEELRREGWVRISDRIAEDEARTAVRLLRRDRPWRAVRLAPA